MTVCVCVCLSLSVFLLSFSMSCSVSVCLGRGAESTVFVVCAAWTLISPIVALVCLVDLAFCFSSAGDLISLALSLVLFFKPSAALWDHVLD